MTTFNLGAAFIAGIATSIHCSGMCGPLVCAAKSNPWHYHGGRFLSYSAAGLLAGWLGEPLVTALQSGPARILAWAMAVVLILVGTGLEKKLPQPRWIARWLVRARLGSRLGLLTPLLPCGPLWLMLGVAAMSGGSLQGSALLASFSLGTLPLFLLIQSGLLRFGPHLSPRTLAMLQRTAALLAACILVWRALLPDAQSCCQH